jgi:O-antigen/teichoic acid export membrane protein
MSISKNIAANFIGNIWQALMGIAFVPLYIRYLGVESYGLIGIFALLQAWLALLDMGMTPTLSREMARFTGGAHVAQSIRNLLRSIEVIGFVIAIFIAFGIWVVSGWLASDWLRAEKLPVGVVAQAFSIMGVVTALRFIENIYRGCIMGLQRQVLHNVVLIVTGTLRGLGAVGILIWISPTIEAFFVWQGTLSIITVCLFSTVLYRMLPVAEHTARFSMTALMEIRHFAAGMLAITFLALLLTQVDKILLSRLLTLEAFGYYALAGTVANALYMLSGPVTAAFYPRFTELVAQDDVAGLIAAYHKSAQLVAVFMGTVAIMLIVFSDVVITCWTANLELSKQVAPLVAVLSLGTLINGLLAIPYQLQLAYGWTSLGVKGNIFAVLIIVPAILYATPKYGPIGAAWVWVGLNIGYVTIAIYFVHRRLLPTEKWRWYWQDVCMPLVAGIITTLLFRFFMWDPASEWMTIIYLAIVSISTLIMTAIATPLTRTWLLSKISDIKFPLG